MLLVRVSISIPEQFPPSGEWRRKKQRGQFVIISISGDMPLTPQPFLCPRLDVYILELGQMHLAIWINTFCNLDKYIWQIWTNTICKFGQIHLANLDKYIWQI